MEVVKSNSGWNFRDLLKKTARQIAEEDFKTYTNPTEVVEDCLIRFLERLPNGDYTNIRKEMNQEVF